LIAGRCVAGADAVLAGLPEIAICACVAIAVSDP
jgi:hypothetical protein